ncbi:hypothetical protein [Enterobacter hormaechei]|uniref:hypothetical protein n=1 Tax=Enterobacter hormaechei TaxID=158836 RepID=UPI000AFA34EA|nr:hypothetical protein [Enterobacter hormaechei]
MDLQKLMEVIGVKKKPFELAPGFTVYIRLPSLGQYSECNDPYKTIYHCVVLEDNTKVFESPEQVEKAVDFSIQAKLNFEITQMFTEAMDIDSIEKK